MRSHSFAFLTLWVNVISILSSFNFHIIEMHFRNSLSSVFCEDMLLSYCDCALCSGNFSKELRVCKKSCRNVLESKFSCFNSYHMEIEWNWSFQLAVFSTVRVASCEERRLFGKMNILIFRIKKYRDPLDSIRI